MILRLASEHTLEFLAFTGLLAMIICISETFLALVGNVRATIQDKESLTVAGKQLENDRALPEYNAHQEHTISLVLDLREGMQTLAKTFSLHVIHQCLVSVSKQLETDRNLSEYDVQKDNPLHLMRYLRGAGLQIYVRTLVLHLGNTLDTALTQLCLRGGMQIFAKTLTTLYLETTFHLVPRLRGGMHIHALEGKTTTLDVKTSNVPGNTQKECILHFVLSLRGHMPISEEPTMQSLPGLREGRQFFGKTMTGKTIPDVIDKVQAKIPDKKGIQTVQQRLTLTSKQFEDGHISAGTHVQKESTLHLALRLCGGTAFTLAPLPPSIPRA